MKKLFLLSLVCMFSLSLVACTNKNEIVKDDIYDENLDEADKFIEYEKEIEGITEYIKEAGYQFDIDSKEVAKWALDQADLILEDLNFEKTNYTEDQYLLAIIVTSLYDDENKVNDYKESFNVQEKITEQEFVFIAFDRGRGMVENDAFFNAIERYDVLDTIFKVMEEDQQTY